MHCEGHNYVAFEKWAEVKQTQTSMHLIPAACVICKVMIHSVVSRFACLKYAAGQSGQHLQRTCIESAYPTNGKKLLIFYIIHTRNNCVNAAYGY